MNQVFIVAAVVAVIAIGAVSYTTLGLPSPDGQARLPVGDVQDPTGEPFPEVPQSPGDTTPPVLVVLSPTPGQTISGIFDVVADANDSGSGIANVLFFVDGTLKFSDNSVPYIFSWNTTQESDGNHTLRVTARDNAGNSTRITREIYVDNIPDGNQTDTNAPTVIITSPTSQPNFDTNFSTINLSGNAIDDFEIVSMNWGVNTDGNGVVSYNSAINTWTASNIPLEIGTNLIIVNAVDSSGNIGSDWISVQRDANAVDTTPPVLVITNPPNGATVSGQVNITADVNDSGTGVNNVKFFVDNVLKFTDFSLPYSYLWNSNTVLDGNHTIKLTATDNANNSTTKTVDINVSNVIDSNTSDTNSPTIVIFRPGNGQIISGTSVIQTLVDDNGNNDNNSSDNNGIQDVKFYIDNNLRGTVTSLPYIYEWNTNDVNNGLHSIMAVVTNIYGFMASDLINVTVNN
jgi:hypothetical protein